MLGIASKNNIRPSTGHVGGNCDCIVTPRLSDNLGLTLMKLGIEKIMRDAESLQFPAQYFRRLNRNRADQNRPAGIVDIADFFDDCIPFFVLGPIDAINLIF